MGEFDLIARYFNQTTFSNVALGIGDDCAIVDCPTDQQIAITTDTMVEHSHFLPNISPADLAYKALASNISDLAAMGATPAWVSLALTLPTIDEQWLAAFSQALFAYLKQENIALIGGDTTKGALHCVTITAQGLLPKGQALQRNAGKAGDYVFVSGTLGDSAAGLALLLDEQKNGENSGLAPAIKNALLARHFRPTPRVALGKFLLKQHFSRCALDISDGLLGDVQHILQKSQCGIVINLEYLPLSQALRSAFPLQQAETFALTGGEDYELCFTVPADKITAFQQAIANKRVPCPVTCIGRLTANTGTVLQRQGKNVTFQASSFDHFK